MRSSYTMTLKPSGPAGAGGARRPAKVRFAQCRAGGRSASCAIILAFFTSRSSAQRDGERLGLRFRARLQRPPPVTPSGPVSRKLAGPFSRAWHASPLDRCPHSLAGILGRRGLWPYRVGSYECRAVVKPPFGQTVLISNRRCPKDSTEGRRCLTGYRPARRTATVHEKLTRKVSRWRRSRSSVSASWAIRWPAT